MDNNFDVLKLENQLCFPLYACSKELIKLYRPYLEKLNLTYTQYITMMVLWKEDKINVKDLGERLFLDSGTLTPVLKSLEAKGYVKRYRYEKDERVLIVEATEEGKGLKKIAQDIPDDLKCSVSVEDEEAVQLYHTLYKILEYIKSKY